MLMCSAYVYPSCWAGMGGDGIRRTLYISCIGTNVRGLPFWAQGQNGGDSAGALFCLSLPVPPYCLSLGVSLVGK